MPEASARRLTEDDRPMSERPVAALRVAPAPDAREGAPRGDSGGERASPEGAAAGSPQPGRPHPRSRISPERAGARVLEENAARVAAAAPRTIVVTGQRTPATRVHRERPGEERRRTSPGARRTVERPDRLALWAVGLGLVLAFMAAATARAEAPAPPSGGAPVVAPS